MEGIETKLRERQIRVAEQGFVAGMLFILLGVISTSWLLSTADRAFLGLVLASFLMGIGLVIGSLVYRFSLKK